MARKRVWSAAIGAAVLAVLCGAGRADGQGKTTEKMAPVEEYLMERNAEIALAKSAAPESISGDATVLVLGRKGYETAVQGKNGFVCMVQRSWAVGPEDEGFWNTKVRSANCFNAAAARTYMQNTLKRTELVLAGKSKEEMFAGLKKAIETKEVPVVEAGAMSYMMAKESYLGDETKHWHPHVMFFMPEKKVEEWGAGMKGSPVMGVEDAADGLSVLFIVVGKWSDGTMDETQKH